MFGSCGQPGNIPIANRMQATALLQQAERIGSQREQTAKAIVAEARPRSITNQNVAMPILIYLRVCFSKHNTQVAYY